MILLPLFVCFSLQPVDLLKKDVAYLASDALEGRFAGTPGCEKAAQYIEKEMKKAGLQPFFGESYRQSFSFIQDVALGKPNTLILSCKNATRVLSADQDFRPLAFSSSGTFSAELVFAGYGITAKDLNHDDYQDLDVKGKVVVVFRFSPDGDDPKSPYYPYMALRYKAFNAKQHGAQGILFVSPPGEKDTLAPLRYDFSFSDVGIPAVSLKRSSLQELISIMPHPPYMDLSGCRVEGKVTLSQVKATTSNICGYFPGKGKSYVFIGAHYDHLGRGRVGSLEEEKDKIHNGADDNASGVATMLEIAREVGCKPYPFHLVFCAFTGEEIGSLGAHYLIKHLPIPKNTLIAMMNLDMVGSLRNQKLIIHGIGSSRQWAPLLASLDQNHPFQSKWEYGGFGASDHAVFYAEGIPVLFFFTGSHERYHTSKDDPEFLNYPGMEAIAGYIQDVLEGIADLGGVTFQEVPEGLQEQKIARRGFRVYFGSIPDYAAEVEGVKLAGVKKGSPAHKAGLQKGDIIIQFGGIPIRNIYDYTYALQEHKPGDKITIKVRRGSKILTFQAVLQPRESKY